MNLTDDLVIVPARSENFKKMFLSGFWSCVEISEARKDHLRYIACYQVKPIAAITAYARIESMKSNPNEPHKYDILFAKPTMLTKPIPLGKRPFGQGRRYASLQRLLNSKTVDDLFD